MRIGNKHLDLIFYFLLILVVVGLPYGIWTYDRQVWQDKIPPGAKEFTLTGHTQRGWLVGDVQAFEVVTLGHPNKPVEKPVIEVRKGDHVVLKLKSSDVVHGFSLKDAGIFITDGIQPGKVVLVSFTADKVGTFTFSCNAICGENHESMQGTLIVRA
jgi:heme/copper-type cytochrome/quinol oxidase subunit 2